MVGCITKEGVPAVTALRRLLESYCWACALFDYLCISVASTLRRNAVKRVSLLSSWTLVYTYIYFVLIKHQPQGTPNTYVHMYILEILIRFRFRFKINAYIKQLFGLLI